MYFDFRTYGRMLRLAGRERDPAQRRRLYATLLGVVPLAATFQAICFALDPLLFPGLRRVSVKTPVFVVGHARSGTTLIHRLLSSDGDRFSTFLMYELFAPSLLQKKAIRSMFSLDRRFLGGRIDRRVRAWDERRYAKAQRMHPMSLFAPEEDDFVLTLSCASGWWIVLMPYMGELDFYHVDRRPARDRRRLMGFYRECIRRQLYLNGENRVHLSKNPTFCGRVESLIETFPDARFVVAVRNPNETIPSLLKLLESSWKMRGWDAEQIARSLRALADQSFHAYRHPLEVLDRHPEVPRAIVDYRNLVSEPKKTIERVYEELGLPVSPAMAAVLDAAQERARTHRSEHRYSLEEFGLRADEIRAELSDLFDRFGWDDAAAPVAKAEP